MQFIFNSRLFNFSDIFAIILLDFKFLLTTTYLFF